MSLVLSSVNIIHIIEHIVFNKAIKQIMEYAKQDGVVPEFKFEESES